jgi:hypothetical protein
VDGNALVLHLINRDFQRKRGFTPSSSTTVEIELPEGFSAEAAEPQLLGPDYHNGEPTPLPKRIITPQRIAVTVPEVTVFASVVVERKK